MGRRLWFQVERKKRKKSDFRGGKGGELAGGSRSLGALSQSRPKGVEGRGGLRLYQGLEAGAGAGCGLNSTSASTAAELRGDRREDWQ